MFEPALIPCPILRTILVESRDHLLREGLPDFFDRLTLLDLRAPKNYGEQVDRAHLFLDWALRSALPWAMIDKAKMLRPVANDVRASFAITGKETAEIVDGHVSRAVAQLRQPGWRSYNNLRAADEILGAAGDALQSIVAAGRIDSPILRGRGSDPRRARVVVELDRAVACATQMIVATGHPRLFADMATIFMETTGTPAPAHGHVLRKATITEAIMGIACVVRWCSKCRMTLIVPSVDAVCDVCQAPWEISHPVADDYMREPIAMSP